MKEHLRPFLIIFLFFVVFSILFYGQSSNFLVDFSREAEIPYQMLLGQKLFKDIFLIYGFWGYFCNFLLYKISANINLILLEANIIAFFISILFYFILNKFLTNKKSALFFTVIFIITSIFSCSTFSFVVPYSFSTLWAYFSIFYIIFSLLYKFDKFLFLMLGLLFVSRIEVFFLIFLFVTVYKIIQKEKFSLDFLYILVFPSIFLLYISLNKIHYTDILNNLKYLKTMAKTSSLTYFYKGMGVLFEIKYFIYNIKNFTLYLLFFAFSYFLYSKNKRILFYIVTILFFAFCNLVFLYNLGVFFLSLLFIYLFCKKKITKFDIVFYFFSLMMSIKSIFALNVFGYANFSFVFVVSNIYLFLTKIFEKKFLNVHFLIFLVFLSFINIKNLILDKKIKYDTNSAQVYLKSDDYKNFTETDFYIKKNIKKDENFVVLPEGQIFNFINKKNWNFYNSTFTPLDFETFSDEYFIKNLSNKKTDYVIFYPRNTKDYKSESICLDYGVDFCSYIVDNYVIAKIVGKNEVLIYKRKDEK